MMTILMWDIIQIMNGYECDGTVAFMRWKMEYSIQRGKASWIAHFIFHWMKISVLAHEWKTFIICFNITSKNIFVINNP